jgi:CopA family copper-resistance protein
MGMGGMAGMDHGSMGGMTGMDHGSMQGMSGMSGMSDDSMQGMSSMSGMDHGSMQGMSGMSGMDGGAMKGMGDMSGMDHGSMQSMSGMDHGSMQGMSGMSGMDGGATKGMDDMQGMSHASMSGMNHGSMQGMGAMQSHPATENGNPLVDAQAMSPTPRLDDPGIGLRNNGRRVLTYSDLRSTFADPDGREPARTIELHLTGHMEKFVWSFNGVKFGDSQPIRLKYGERVRLVLVNDTMMTHPIHLHGMWSDLEDDQGRFMVRKHTIDIAPGSKRSYRVTADALGRWAYHCHLLFHMETGMFREVAVEE